MNSYKKNLSLLVLLAAFVWLAGCSGNDSPQPQSTSSTQAEPQVVSVGSLKEQDPGTEWIIEGTVFRDDGGSTRMCDSVLESDPPQCGTPEIFLLGLPDDIEFTEVTVEGREPLAELRLHIRLEDSDSAHVVEVLEIVDVDGPTPKVTE